MTQILTIVCKLQPSDEQIQHVDNTLEAFAGACNWVHETVPSCIRNKDRMQAMVYYEIRERFGLSANLAIQAIRRVAMNRKAAHTNKSKMGAFDPGSIQYDARIFSSVWDVKRSQEESPDFSQGRTSRNGCRAESDDFSAM